MHQQFFELSLFSFSHKKIIKVNGKNNMMEIRLEDARRVLKLQQSKGASLTEGELLSSHLKARGFLVCFVFLEHFLKCSAWLW